MHLVETMTYAGDVPWHGLGQKLSDDARFDVATAIRMAGLDWNVSKVAIRTVDGEDVPEQFAVRRSSDRKIMGVVGDRYETMQNEDAFAWFQPFLDTKEVTLESAGALLNH